jgi:hypothetical protein
MKHPLLMLVIAAALTACDPNTVTTPTPAPGSGPGPAPATPAPAPLTPTGHGLPVKALPQDAFQYAASVTEVHDLTRQGDLAVKLFGMAGGDPAMNGLQTHIAFYRSPAEGWWVFGFGDFLSFRVLAETPGRVDLEVEESVMDPATNVISAQKRRMILAFTATETVETSPPSVRVMPAA